MWKYLNKKNEHIKNKIIETKLLKQIFYNYS